MIKVTNLNKYYNKGKANELHVINNTSIEFADTGLVCILGESGSGKTTLMNTISGLDDFVDGQIQVDEKVISKFGSDEQEVVRNEKFGYIFQNYYLLQDRTVEYNIKLALSLYDITEEEKDERIDYVLKAVDMSRYKKRPVAQLSGGQQQRIAIARALAKTPRVIFADEPTGNLDEANTMKIMSILKKLSKDCLVVVVTHERSIADFFADRIIWIADGKIEKEVTKESQGVYQFVDDTNIYLQEFDKNEYQNDSLKINTYTTGDEKIDIEIKIIYENGKLYFYSEENANIEFITGDSEKKVIDSKRPTMDIEQVDSLEYTLEKIESAKKPKMSFREIFQIALANIKNMGKKQIFLIVSLVAVSVLIVLTVQNIMSVFTVDKQSIVTSDSHYLKIAIEKNGLINNDKMRSQIDKLMDEVFKADLDGFSYVSPKVFMDYEYSGFWQLEDVESRLTGYSLVPLDALNAKDVVYGRMPEAPYEIVVDRWVLESFIGGGNEFSNVITSVKHFLGKNIKVSSTSTEKTLTIVGISNTEEPSIYVDAIVGLGLSSWSRGCMSLEQLNSVTDNKYSKVSLKEGEVLVSKTLYDEYVEDYFDDNYNAYYQIKFEGREPWNNRWWKVDYEEYMAEREVEYGISYDEFLELVENPTGLDLICKTTYGGEYEIKGYFDDIYGMEMVVSDSSYELLLKDNNKYRREFYVYTNDKELVTDFFTNKVSGAIRKDLNITVVDLYEEDMKVYNEKRAEELSGGIIIVTVTIFVISMIILYFMMKANAIKRMQDIGVYRLLGISKGSIVWLFGIENILLTSYTSVVGAVVTMIVYRFIASIPALNINFVYPWYAVVGTILFFYVVNTLIGILPIRKILRLPPAQLAAKYDI
ncbi:MAG: ABC transporter ATP-binding protein/permease [Lachnospiraceae bacterium]|nr:ABC transporter ATP-binding protein/permease [Lachnospiraceae bacterium]